MNDSHNRSHYRTVYGMNKRRIDPGAVFSVGAVAVVLIAFFTVLLILN